MAVKKNAIRQKQTFLAKAGSVTGSVTSRPVALASHEAGRGKRYPRELKTRIAEYAGARRGDGASWAQIAGDIVIAFETLRRRCVAVEPKGSRAMVPVRVIADDADRRVTVASPAGYRIEGISLREAVAVLRALG